MTYFKTLFAKNGDKKEIPLTDRDEKKVSWERGYPITYAVTDELPKEGENVEREQINYLLNKITVLNNQLVTYDKTLYQQQEIKNVGQIIYDDTAIKIVVSEYDALDITKTTKNIGEKIVFRGLAEEIASEIGRNGIIILNDFNKEYFDWKLSEFQKLTNYKVDYPWQNLSVGVSIQNDKHKSIFETMEGSNWVDNILVGEKLWIKKIDSLFLQGNKYSYYLGRKNNEDIPRHEHDFECLLGGEHKHTGFKVPMSENIAGYGEVISSGKKEDTTPIRSWEHYHEVTPREPSEESGIGDHTRPKNVAFFARMFLVEEDEHGSTVPAIEKIIRAL